VICVLLTTVSPVAPAPPKVTEAPDKKPVPLILTDVPPLLVPLLGVIELTVGAGFPVPPPPLARNVAICITQAAEYVSEADAL
jgi:hypothetical protein